MFLKQKPHRDVQSCFPLPWAGPVRDSHVCYPRVSPAKLTFPPAFCVLWRSLLGTRPHLVTFQRPERQFYNWQITGAIQESVSGTHIGSHLAGPSQAWVICAYSHSCAFACDRRALLMSRPERSPGVLAGGVCTCTRVLQGAEFSTAPSTEHWRSFQSGCF